MHIYWIQLFQSGTVFILNVAHDSASGLPNALKIFSTGLYYKPIKLLNLLCIHIVDKQNRKSCYKQGKSPQHQ